MSHGDVITNLLIFYVKGSKLKELKPFFHGQSPHTTY